MDKEKYTIKIHEIEYGWNVRYCDDGRLYPWEIGEIGCPAIVLSEAAMKNIVRFWQNIQISEANKVMT